MPLFIDGQMQSIKSHGEFWSLFASRESQAMVFASGLCLSPSAHRCRFFLKCSFEIKKESRMNRELEGSLARRLANAQIGFLLFLIFAIFVAPSEK